MDPTSQPDSREKESRVSSRRIISREAEKKREEKSPTGKKKSSESILTEGLGEGRKKKGREGDDSCFLSVWLGKQK